MTVQAQVTAFASIPSEIEVNRFWRTPILEGAVYVYDSNFHTLSYWPATKLRRCTSKRV
jgi:hypothetical protein